MMIDPLDLTADNLVALPPMPMDGAEQAARGAALLALAAETERAEWASGLKDAQVRDVAGPGFIPAPVQLNPHQQLLAEAAQARGLSARAVPSSQVTRNPLPRMVLMIDAPGGPVVYHSQFLSWLGPDGRVNRPVNGPRTFDLLDKVKTKRHLLANGIPVPAGQAFRREDLAGAFRYAAACEGELCVKPVNGANGHNVLPCLRTAEDVRSACLAVAAEHTAFLIEESVPGQAWRFFYVRPAIVGIKLGRPANVVGNGFNTIRDLAAIAASERLRRLGPGARPQLEIHPLHQEIILRRQGVTEETVPSAGQRVFLSSLSNGSQGADSLARPESVHPALTERVKDAIELFTGVQAVAADVIIADPADPASALSVVEINAAPSLVAYHRPAEGPVQDVAGAIADLLVTLREPN